jgi:hypothetical protein
MEVSVLIEMGKQCPALAVLGWIVYKFLNAQKDERASRDVTEKACHEVNEKVAEKVAKALDRNTEAFGKNVQCLEQMADLISVQTVKEIKR